MLLSYLKQQYQINEPIFLSDIKLPVTDTNLRQMFKVLCDSGKLRRFDNGIYYLPGTSRLKGGVTLSASEVARCKYISRNEQVLGYYSGYTFANQLGLTTQVPFTIEIVSNQTSAKYREVAIQNQKIVLRKPRTEITAENCDILQLLDLLKDFDQYVDEDMDRAADRMLAYAKKLNVRRADVDQYLQYYPDRIYKTIYEMRLYDAFT